MPVRKIPKSYRNVTGVSPHMKAIGRAEYESSLESDFLTLLEFNPLVARFEVQPVRIEWEDANGKARRYTPDTLVYFTNYIQKPVLYEVKYRKDLRKKWDVLRPQFKAAIRYAQRNNWRFKIITEKEIRTTFLKNARFLLSFVRRELGKEEHMVRMLERLEETGASTPEELITTISKDRWQQAEILPSLWVLIGNQRIEADLNHPLTMASQIRIRKP